MTEHDPLTNNSDNARQLFQSFSNISHGFSTLDVANASLNMLVNAVRQASPTAQAASELWDEWIARSKGLLMDSYTATGRKKGVYPYTQTLIANPVSFKMKKPG